MYAVKFLNLLRKIEEILLASTMIIILLLIFSQALFRYFFGSGLIWGEELARYIHVAQIWLGGSLAIKKGGHIRVTFFRDLFNTQGRKFIDLIATLLFFTFMVFIAVKGTEFILHLIGTGQKAPSMGILMAIPYTVVPLGGLLMAIRLVQQFRMIWKGKLLDAGIEGVDK
ncbi:hypothetical protein BI350_07760 [Sporosarcina ureilytica]|uniref:Tripartite ATP-independent periplasmic transporters DctQ component domain-containing protein n=1 Tax=Sporosarcina ureilytica TaxID=298596 RepID=A0A1D8JFF1_9BACL|nr:hypothetical protein BI350_07760 [Sporosarcina ureilytica]